MKIQRFEDILAWQKAKQLNIELYNLLKGCRDYSFKDQLQRASVSIMNNIAEGYERQSNKELRQFLYIAKGSSAEVRSMLDLALELGYISKNNHSSLHKQAEDTSKMLSGFIKTL